MAGGDRTPTMEVYFGKTSFRLYPITVPHPSAHIVSCKSWAKRVRARRTMPLAHSYDYASWVRDLSVSYTGNFTTVAAHVPDAPTTSSFVPMAVMFGSIFTMAKDFFRRWE